jgi:outer membrane protein assembly factor BamB
MIMLHDTARTDPSFRLFNSRNAECAVLIRPDGSIVHEWCYEQGFSWHYAEMLPSGNLVAIAKDKMILEIDPAGELVWKHEGHAHHDFARKEDGNTYVISGRPESSHTQIDKRRSLYLDHIEEVAVDGRVVWTWLPEDHVEELRGFVELILPLSAFDDWPHLNTVEILPENPTGKRDARFCAGNLLVCGRHIDTIFVVDRTSGEVVWAWGPGELLGPHMPTMLPNGNLLVYDNGSNTSRQIRGYTRILELDPLSGRICWEYKSPSNFFSPARGSAERLPNGNCFIAHADSGRLFEVTPEGDMVWEFLNDMRVENGGRAAIYRSKHYPAHTVPDGVL